MLKHILKNIIFRLLVNLLPKYSQSHITHHTTITTLTRHQDIDMLIYSTTSFFYFSKINLKCHIWHDGSLTKQDIFKLKRHFNCHVYNCLSNANQKRIAKKLKPFKNLSRFRFDKQAKVLRYKLDPILLTPSTKYIYLDSDILFFHRPTQIVNWLNRHTNNFYYTAHLPYPPHYYHRQEELINFSFRVLLFTNFKHMINPTFNSGLLCISNQNKINISQVDTVFADFYHTDYAHHYLAEETSLSFMSTRPTFIELNPANYLNNWCPEEYYKNFSNSVISSHFSAESRCLYQFQAIKLAIKTKLFHDQTFLNIHSK